MRFAYEVAARNLLIWSYRNAHSFRVSAMLFLLAVTVLVFGRFLDLGRLGGPWWLSSAMQGVLGIRAQSVGTYAALCTLWGVSLLLLPRMLCWSVLHADSRPPNGGAGVVAATVVCSSLPAALVACGAIVVALELAGHAADLAQIQVDMLGIVGMERVEVWWWVILILVWGGIAGVMYGSRRRGTGAVRMAIAIFLMLTMMSAFALSVIAIALLMWRPATNVGYLNLANVWVLAWIVFAWVLGAISRLLGHIDWRWLLGGGVCSKCGYDLRGGRGYATCPECGSKNGADAEGGAETGVRNGVGCAPCRGGGGKGVGSL